MKLGAMNHPRRNVIDEIKRIAGAGFDFIDLTIEEPATAPTRGDWPVVRRAIEDAGLAVVGHAAPYLPLDNPSPLVRQAALDELRRTLDVAATLGAPLCTPILSVGRIFWKMMPPTNSTARRSPSCSSTALPRTCR